MAMLDLLLKGDFVGKGKGGSKKADKTKGEKEVTWDRGTVVFVDFGGVVEGEGGKMEMLRGVAEDNDLGFLGLRAEDVFDPDLRRRLGGKLDQERPGYGYLAVDLKSQGEISSGIRHKACVDKPRSSSSRHTFFFLF